MNSMVELLKSGSFKQPPENAQSNLPAQSRVSEGRQPRTGSFRVLNIARNGDPITSPRQPGFVSNHLRI